MATSSALATVKTSYPIAIAVSHVSRRTTPMDGLGQGLARGRPFRLVPHFGHRDNWSGFRREHRLTERFEDTNRCYAYP
jgi:hypothetical protein